MIRRSRLLGDNRLPSKDIQRLSSHTLTPSEIPPIQAAQMADQSLELDKECILERSRVVSIAPARMPYIGLVAKYNKRWYVDIVSLPNNAIRLFISRLFEVITAVHRLVLDMTEDDFDLLFSFIAEFDRFVRVLLEAEDKILYPECDKELKKAADYQNHKLNPEVRGNTKVVIYQLLSNITNEDLRLVPAMTVAATLQENVDKLSSRLMEYFVVKEHELPRILCKSMRGHKEKNRLEGRLLKFFDDLDKQFYYTTLLITPLQSEDVRTDFEERHFAKTKREAFREEVQRVNDTLLSIPKAFDQAAAKYESRFSMQTFLQHYGQNRDPDIATEIIE